MSNRIIRSLIILIINVFLIIRQKSCTGNDQDRCRHSGGGLLSSNKQIDPFNVNC